MPRKPRNRTFFGKYSPLGGMSLSGERWQKLLVVLAILSLVCLSLYAGMYLQHQRDVLLFQPILQSCVQADPNKPEDDSLSTFLAPYPPMYRSSIHE